MHPSPLALTEAERQFSVLRPDIRQRLVDRDAAEQAERDAAMERFLALDPEAQERQLAADPAIEGRLFEHYERLVAERGPSIAEAMETLHGALERDADIVWSKARAEARRELEQERQAMQAAAASAAPTDLGEVEMQIQRDETGRIKSPVQITTERRGQLGNDVPAQGWAHSPRYS